MIENSNSKLYDLEERTQKFAKRCRLFVKKLPKTIGHIEDGKQLIRSSGSTAANYIEANEAVSKKDFVLRVKVARKEAKESRMWIDFCEVDGSLELRQEQEVLIKEATEFIKIFTSIIGKSSV